MKKFYVAPEMEVEKIAVEAALLMTSQDPNGGSEDMEIGGGVVL